MANFLAYPPLSKSSAVFLPGTALLSTESHGGAVLVSVTVLGSSAGVLAPGISLGVSLRRWLHCAKKKAEVLVFSYDPLYDCAAWWIPLAFRLWLVVTIAGRVMLPKMLWKSRSRGGGRGQNQYPSPPERLPMSVLLARGQGNLGALPAPHGGQAMAHGLAPRRPDAPLGQRSGDLGLHIQHVWGSEGYRHVGFAVVWHRGVNYSSQGYRGGVSRDFGGGFLSAALWLLGASFFISSLFVFWNLLQCSFKSETRSKLCKEKWIWFFENARFEVALKNTFISKKNLLSRALSS